VWLELWALDGLVESSPMNITETVAFDSAQGWREWLMANHQSKSEIWLLLEKNSGLTYLGAVQEALCFGWIDGIAKKHNTSLAQRFTPRRKKSNWTELNKQRARRLIAAGKMTQAGLAVLPDLNLEFRVADDILAAIQKNPEAWQYFGQLEQDYICIRVGYIEEMRRQPEVFQSRLQNFIAKTAKGKTFGMLE
jgi:uncharacterized protein YdeI (YjbR/CyaY-like superfamily)